MTTPFATEKYLGLVEELGAVYGRGRGWKSKVAAKLGVTPSYISQITTGRNFTVGQEAMSRAIEALGLPADYFTTGEPGDDAEAVAIRTLAALSTDARERVLRYALERWQR